MILLAACSPEPGSKAWCEAKGKQPKSEWTGSDASSYAQHCLFDGTEVGSEQWCKKLAEKDKSKWSSEDAATYAKHCVL